MIEVKIVRPDIRGAITLTMHGVARNEDPDDLKDLLLFLTEVARAAGYPYVEDIAALTGKGTLVITETEFLDTWKRCLDKSNGKKEGSR